MFGPRLDELAVRAEVYRTQAEFEAILSARSAILSSGRSSTPDKSYDLACRWASFAGVTRIAETTRLDRLGLPTFYAVRPTAVHPSAIVSSGKGTTRSFAILSALFEAHERWAAEQVPEVTFSCTAHVLTEQFANIRTCAPRELDPHESLDWVVGFDLVKSTPCFMPLRSAVFPYLGPEIRSCSLPNTTNGLATGTDPAEAIASALLEVIERDAVARLRPVDIVRVDPAHLEPAARDIAHRFERNGIGLSLCYCPSPIGVPVFYGISRDEHVGLSVFFCSGAGAHLDPTVAATRALTEVGQSRAGFISSLREDVSQRIEQFLAVPYDQRRDALQHWFTVPSIAFTENVNRLIPATFQDEIEAIIGRIVCVEPDAIVAALWMARYPGIFTFRVICPTMLLPVPMEHSR